MSVNKAILVGRLGADPEMRFTGTGRAVCNFRIATDSVWKDRDGNRQKRTEWHKIVVWRRPAANTSRRAARSTSRANCRPAATTRKARSTTRPRSWRRRCASSAGVPSAAPVARWATRSRWVAGWAAASTHRALTTTSPSERMRALRVARSGALRAAGATSRPVVFVGAAPVVAPQSIPRSAKLAHERCPTTTWSRMRMPSSSPAARKRPVSVVSSGEGSGSPLG